ncbi:retrovirus-related pol polyprotein from transposon TNT 1-94, partial [Trifolium medium]|nr:retrovirus-related pol polyprotein from transposon TNT 1-94 [Trifolium medium]
FLTIGIRALVRSQRSYGSQIRVGVMAAYEGKVKIETFDGADFGFWKMHIEDYLYQKMLYQPLTGKKPTEMKDDEWKLVNREALGVIRLSLSRNIAFNIAKEKTTASLMAALTSMYEKPSASNKVHLMRQLILLSSLPDSWSATVTAVSCSSGSKKLKFDDVRDLVLSEEIHRRELGESSSSFSIAYRVKS